MLRSGSSYLSQSELVLTFGLGTQTKADTIEIQWPSGHIDKLSNIVAGQTITVQEAKGVIANRPYGRNKQHEGPRFYRRKLRHLAFLREPACPLWLNS